MTMTYFLEIYCFSKISRRKRENKKAQKVSIFCLNEYCYSDCKVILYKEILAFVSDQAGAEGMIDDETEIFDYSDDYIVPGFVDGHCHAYVSGGNQFFDFNLPW